MKMLMFCYLVFFGFILHAQNFTDSLLLHYNFSNGQAIDQSGNGHHGSVNASSSYDRFGIADKALHFNGIDQYVELPNVSALKPQLPVSIAYWVKFDTLLFTNTWVFDSDYQENTYTGVWSGYNPNNSSVVVEYGDGGTTNANQRRSKATDLFSIYTKTWYLFTVVVRGPQDMDIYVDCELVDGVYSGNGGALEYSSNPGYIGLNDRAGTPPNFLLGDVDEVWYWNRAINLYDLNVLCNLSSDPENTNSFQNFNLYPNPVFDMMTITYPDDNENYRVDIYNSLGILMFSVNETEKPELSKLPDGIYIVRLMNSNNEQRGIKSFIKL